MESSAKVLSEVETVDPVKPGHSPSEPARTEVEESLDSQGIGIALVGMLIAMWGAMCGIGGGIFAVPCLHYLYKLKLRESVVMSLSLVAATTISATLAEVIRWDSHIDWRIVGALVAGSLVGAQVGFRVSNRIEARKLKLVFSVVLALVGLRILGFVPESLASDGGSMTQPGLGPGQFVIAGVIGLGGGFVAPLLGIGGGLVAVPALMFALPSLGHLGARACSMAMATVTSTRSIVLYYRSGEFELRRSMTFALGAAVGAFIGVQLVHIPGIAVMAKQMLAGTLLVVALRFAIDLIQDRNGKKV